MASSIKGITIKIDGDTTGLSKSLTNVNKSLAETQKALRDVNKALKLDPKNVDTLKQKQELLSKAIKDTQEKLKLEKEAADKAAEALKNGTITQGEYDQLQAEVSKTAAELKNLGEQAEATNQQIQNLGGSNFMASFQGALDDAAAKLQQIGEQLQALGEGMTKYVSVPLAAAGTAAYKSFLSVDDALDIVAQKTGATGEELDAMKEAARGIATEIPTDFETAAEAVGEVNTRFNLTGDELQSLSKKYVKFAKLNNTDVTSAVDSTQKALAAFGEDSKYASRLLDVLTRVSQNTGVNITTLENGLVQNAAAFEELGLNIDQSAALMGRFEKSGANGETVMQGFRKALKNATKDGIPLSDALRDLNDTIKYGTDDMDGLTYAYELFGKSGDQIYSAIQNGTLDFGDLSTAAGELSGSIGVVDDTYKNFEDGSGQLKVAQNNLKDALSEVGNTLSETLAPIIKKMTDKIKDFKDWWDKLGDGTKDVIIKIGLFMTVAGPLIIFVGKIIVGLGTIFTLIGKIAGFIAATLIPKIAAIGTTMTMSLGIIAAVVLAIIAVIEVIKNWTAICELAKEIWNAFINWIKGLITGFAEWWSGTWDSICQFVKDAWDGLKQFLSDIWDAIKLVFSEVGEWFTGIFQSAWDGITGVWSAVTGWFSDLWSSIKDIFSEVGEWFRGIFEGAKDIVGSIIDAMVEVIKAPINALIGLINVFISGLNKIKIPSWVPLVGGKGINIPEIPYLAKGGILEKGQIGFLEGSGAEAVVPLENNKKWIDATARQMQLSIAQQSAAIDYRPYLERLLTNGGDMSINLSIGQQSFDTMVQKSIQRTAFRSGGRA